MDDKIFAKHLRKPEGEVGKAVGLIMNSINKSMNLTTYDKMNISQADRVLEIGFGNGAFIHHLFEINNDISYTGIEISEVMIEEAKKNIRDELNDKVKLIKSSSDSLKFNGSAFNKVCVINTFYFWKNPMDDLKEIYRVLEDGSKLFISIRSKETMQKNSFSQYYFRLYTYNEISNLLQSAGYTNIAVTRCEESEKELDFLIISCQK